MKRSTERILTTHVGSLPRPADLRAMWAKKTVTAEDEGALQTRLRSAIGEIVRAQKSAGIDIPNDGEFGKPMRAATDRGAWGNYIFDRVSASRRRRRRPSHPTLLSLERRCASSACAGSSASSRNFTPTPAWARPAPRPCARPAPARSLTPRSSFCATSSST